MPKQLLSIPSFTAGELSSSMEGRTDFAKYFNGASNIENFVVLPHGPITRRPGTYFVSEVKTSANSTRLIPFTFSTEQTYVLEFGNQYIRFFKDNGQITEGNKTITPEHWSDLTGSIPWEVLCGFKNRLPRLTVGRKPPRSARTPVKSP